MDVSILTRHRRFVDKEFNLLKELMNNKGTIQNNKISMEQYHFLYMLGIVSYLEEIINFIL